MKKNSIKNAKKTENNFENNNDDLISINSNNSYLNIKTFNPIHKWISLKQVKM
jgi:hypothetical protein